MNKTVAIQFDTVPYVLEGQVIARLPDQASKKLPSRGQVAGEITVNGQVFLRVLEPDGNWGHWLRIDDELQNKAGVARDKSVSMHIVPTKNWPEPNLPTDVENAFARAPQKVNDKWQDITTMARWEWIRWIGATANAGTRAVRIEKTISKLNGTHRRPCCFNLAACTDPALSKSGRLIGIL